MNNLLKILSSEKVKEIFLIFLFALTTHIITIANPGFFNHDEWQKFDHIYTFGLNDFVQTYGKVQAGPDFGFPVRPIGFVQQAIASMFMIDYPWITHLIDVFIHFACAVSLLLLLSSATDNRKIQLFTTIVFIVSPLCITSTSWVGASFDRLFTLFSILALYFLLLIAKTNRWLYYFGLTLSCICAMLSKETAVMLPVVIFITYICIQTSKGKKLNEVFSSKNIYLVCITVAAPFLIYLTVRFPALVSSFSGHNAAASYSINTSNIIQNFVYYWAYPFTLHAYEMISMKFISQNLIYFGFIIHTALFLVFFFRSNIFKSSLYLFYYFVFLIPVISIENIGAHYLYASAPALSYLIGYLFYDALVSKRKFLYVTTILIFIISLGRFLNIQAYFYNEGMCQFKIVNSINSILSETTDQPLNSINIIPDVDSRGYIAHRTFFARSSMGPYKDIKFSFDQPTEKDDVDNLNLHLNSSCLLYR